MARGPVYIPPDFLIVTQAVSTADALRAALPIPGLHGSVRVHALGGPIRAWGPGRGGLTLRLEEVGLVEAAPERTEALLRAASRVGEVVLVAPPGDAGPDLALDIAEVVSLLDADRQPAALSLVRPAAFTRDAMSAAFATRRVVGPADAAPGRAWRLMERALGAALPAEAGDLGPVDLAVLAVLGGRTGDPVVAVTVLRLPAADGGRDFVAELAVSRTTSNDHAMLSRFVALAAARLPPVRVARRVEMRAALPLVGQVLLEATRLGFPLAEADRALRSLYEAGRLPWPWPPGTVVAPGLSPAGLHRLAALADAAGLLFDPGLLPLRPAGLTFEGLHPLPGADVVFASDPAHLDAAGALLAIVARHAVAAGIQDRHEEEADTSGLPTWARSLTWRRAAGGWHPGMRDTRQAGVHRLARDEILVRAMADHGLGGSEEWGGIARRLGRGWIDDEARPTEAGEAALGAANPSLLDPKIVASALNGAASAAATLGARAPWRRMAALALAELPPPLRSAIADALSGDPTENAAPPPPRPAPRAASLAAGLARLRSARPGSASDTGLPETASQS